MVIDGGLMVADVCVIRQSELGRHNRKVAALVRALVLGVFRFRGGAVGIA